MVCHYRYYKSHKEVRQDTELQTFARDTSVGSGKVRWFQTVTLLDGAIKMCFWTLLNLPQLSPSLTVIMRSKIVV